MNNEDEIIIGTLPNCNNAIQVFIHKQDICTIPHFHIRRTTKYTQKWECTISLHKNDYLKHIGICNKTIHNRDTKKLDIFLRQFNGKDIHCRTFWQILIDTWNFYNDNKFPIDYTQPNYDRL